jgi:ectoine hydroxylase-related dioxygenase (phytanoyl-CoA dioxygenase family)
MLTDEQKEQYKEQGFTLVSGIFSPAELDELEEAYDGVVQRRVSGREEPDATWQGSWNKAQGETRILAAHDVQAHSAVWGRALFHEGFTAALAGCLGGPNVQLHHTKLFQKPTEKGSGFPMHQDHPYFPHERHTMMAAIIHLTDADEEMGCVRVYPGSHKLGPLPCYEHNHLNPDEYPLEKATKCEAKRGDVLFFNYLTIHGSGPNRSERTRKTVLVQARDPLDAPTVDTHRSNAQGMMLRGVNPNADHVVQARRQLATAD